MTETSAVAPAHEPGFARWIEAFRSRAQAAGISDATYDRAFRDVGYNADVIEKDRNQDEFSKQIWDYLDAAVSPERINEGKAALRENAGLLDRLEARYGVEKEIVLAVWGLESAYGRKRGSISTIEALATLAHDGRRKAFFEGELLAALRILEDRQTTIAEFKGSWAGAMGHTQFMPSSYLALAEDFDGDGRRDIWSDDPADALASTAGYLSHHGWTKGQPWGLEVRLPTGFDYTQSGKRTKKPVAEWMAMGVRDTEGRRIADAGRASILLPAGAEGAAFMIFDNFRVIARYNPADAYVIAVGHLADRIRGGTPIEAGWPRGDRALRYAEKIEVQERLTEAGFDTQGIDGIIGPNTVAAVRRYQASQGLIPDGYVSLEVLRRLR